ncbi:MAG: FAD-dependent oxidoreductase [Thermaerobacter sp.]|jgi:heterodisulfide reductase subunit A|nr:FAD-dependent oxidoreductase [Thermaerobacter sp.]MDA8146636.1 FAD-dependent oxidoreductase [Thermaerobacter sp.]
MENVVVIGGGPAGLKAAAELRSLGLDVALVEKAGVLGGTPVQEKFALLAPELRPAEEVVGALVKAVQQDGVQVHLNSTVTAVAGQGKDFTLTVQNGKGEERLQAGAVIIATGYEHFDPSVKPEYGYGVFPDVITSAQLEGMLSDGKVVRPSNGQVPKKVAILQCIGSRDAQVERKYCCRVGCVVASKQAVELRQKYPDMQVYIFYMDIRTYGRGFEELYWKAQDDFGVRFIRGRGAEVRRRGDELLLKAEETLKARASETPFDMVVLTVGMGPSEGTKAMASLFGLPVAEDGFVEPADRMLAPVSTKAAGVFVAGTALGPKDIEDAALEGAAAALRAAAYLKGGK